jgi:hypothetical protein
LFGYDPEKYAPIMGVLPAGPQKVLAAVRLSLGMPEIELDFKATDAQGQDKIEVPVTVIETHQVKALRTCLVELTFGGLKPGPHTLTIAARDKSGAEANETTAAFTVK